VCDAATAAAGVTSRSTRPRISSGTLSNDGTTLRSTRPVTAGTGLADTAGDTLRSTRPFTVPMPLDASRVSAGTMSSITMPSTLGGFTGAAGNERTAVLRPGAGMAVPTGRTRGNDPPTALGRTGGNDMSADGLRA